MVTVALLCVILGIAVAQAKEIPLDYTFCHTGTEVTVSASKELTVSSFESRGITRSNIEDKSLDDHTFHCVGVERSGRKVQVQPLATARWCPQMATFTLASFLMWTSTTSRGKCSRAPADGKG